MAGHGAIIIIGCPSWIRAPSEGVGGRTRPNVRCSCWHTIQGGPRSGSRPPPAHHAQEGS